MTDTEALVPSAKIPPGILSKVFSYACLDHIYLNSEPGPRPIQISLMHVNREWRQTALGCQSIWATLEMHFSWDDFEDDKSFDSFLALWSFALRCARDALLDITLHIVESRRDLHPREAAIIAEALPTSRQWRRATLVFFPDYRNDDLARKFAGLQGNLPYLESIDLHVRYSAPIEDTVTEAPLLRRASCTWMTSFVNLPWAQLTSVELQLNRYGVASLRVLETCPLLVTLSLQVFDAGGPLGTRVPPIEPPLNLQRVTEFSTNWDEWLYDSLVLPQLIILNVAQVAPWYDWMELGGNFLHPFVEHSGCSVRTLKLPRCDSEMVADLYASATNVQHLVIDTRGSEGRPVRNSRSPEYDVGQLPQILTALADINVLPSLRSVCVRYWSWHPILSLDAIIERLQNLVRARFQRGLERVFIDMESLSDEIDPRVSAKLVPPQEATEASPGILRELQEASNQYSPVINVRYTISDEPWKTRTLVQGDPVGLRQIPQDLRKDWWEGYYHGYVDASYVEQYTDWLRRTNYLPMIQTR
ncbi:hypothetical protein CYLTODRAFT_494347 [Cylindrobasidium torrendii FP15055 ss-10]|uniref:F-box domain-containing protein n=1 Tax=Cylindrobasidium torrendii FP15055 ss-10 TaxID=1314674 RepID=A0A0D7AY11_9AGAR|nr:hypothetical protein CYLTODRAFT_494347 [Cylindrobasidium torrendii FP15055 ss-10]